MYHAVNVVEEDKLFHIHEKPNPDCPIGANIQAVLEVILIQAQSALEEVLRNITMGQLFESLQEKNACLNHIYIFFIINVTNVITTKRKV